MRKLKVLLAAAAILFAGAKAYSQNAVAKVVLLPAKITLEGEGISQQQFRSVGDVIFKSFYTFLSVLPFVDMPDSASLSRIRWTGAGLPSEATRGNPDYVLYTDIEMTGDANYPDVTLRLHIWSRAQDREVFTRTYKTSMGIELFDAMDELLIQSAKSMFSIDAKLASIRFSRFDIGNEPYQIYANNRRLAVISNSTQGYEIKALAGVDYHIMVERLSDHVMVVNAAVRLKENASTNITYSAKGLVHIQPLMYADPARRYSFSVDGAEISNDAVLSNLSAGMEHHLMVLDNLSAMQYYRSFYLQDNRTVSVQPVAKWGGTFHARTFALGGAFGGIGLDVYPSRKFYLGLDVAYAVRSKDLNAETVSVNAFNFTLDAGYHFLGDMEYPVRLSAGVSLGASYLFPLENWQAIVEAQTGSPDTYPNANLLALAFVQFEWKILYARVAAGYASGTQSGFAFMPSVGFKY